MISFNNEFLDMDIHASNLNFIWKYKWKTVDLNTKSSCQNKTIYLKVEIYMQIDQNDKNDVKKI